MKITHRLYSFQLSYSKIKLFRQHFHHAVPLSSTLNNNQNAKKRTVLGIETSCDDTGAAIVDDKGRVLGEALHIQTARHNETGGIIPTVAKELHIEHVESVVEQALNAAQMRLQDVDAIAVTVKPGLVMSLHVGLQHAQKLASSVGKQLIPIHHMEAHALTARMINKIDFPFMVLLASGGHCLLAVAKGIDDFLLLGSSHDSAPGEAYDKTARELNLFKLPELSGISGGASVERLAREGDHKAFPPVHVMTSHADCNFSFAGLKTATRRLIQAEYQRLGLQQSEVLPNVPDICAWFQYNLVYHIARRLQRALIFAEMKNLLSTNKTLVVSGGVASNAYVRENLIHVCSLYSYRVVFPPSKLCTDNGIMIAWNGMEKLLSGHNYFCDLETLQVEPRCPFGTDISADVTNCLIKLPKLRLKSS
ncbi:putative tRNA N6-adenosine threonylcarbamoyltransferase, mitochondrial [Bulinus truncatus]|nr:putative tRNA N6-adenosine threonylcarbamoyltransferase, mitochondrial [Bulinus truncatus]